MRESRAFYSIIKMFIILRCVFCKEYSPTTLMTVIVGLVSLVTDVIDEVNFSRTLFSTAECQCLWEHACIQPGVPIKKTVCGSCHRGFTRGPFLAGCASPVSICAFYSEQHHNEASIQLQDWSWQTLWSSWRDVSTGWHSLHIYGKRQNRQITCCHH